MYIADTNAIQWSKNPEEKSFLSDHMVEEFERYFKGEYIRPQCITRDAEYLYDFLCTLTKQELDIFLKLKANYAKGYTDKNFTEILIYCINKTGPIAKRPLLFSLDYILTKNELSKDTVIKSVEIIENIANSDNANINSISRKILDKINKPYHPKTESQYVFDYKEEYEFYKQLREIIKRAKNTIKFWDNYANHEIIDYIDAYADKKNLNDIKIIFREQNNQIDLKLAQSKFRKQYPNIPIEIKQSSKTHDRFLLFNDEKWGLGPSIKDGGKGACFISQIKDNAGIKIEKIFDDVWQTLTPIQ